MPGFFQNIKSIFSRKPPSEFKQDHEEEEVEREVIEDEKEEVPDYYTSRSQEGSRPPSLYYKDKPPDDSNDEVESLAYKRMSTKSTAQQPRFRPIYSDEDRAMSLTKSPASDPKSNPSSRPSTVSPVSNIVPKQAAPMSPKNTPVPPTNVSVRSEKQNSLPPPTPAEPIRAEPSVASTNQQSIRTLRENILNAVKENQQSFPVNPKSTLAGFPRTLNRPGGQSIQTMPSNLNRPSFFRTRGSFLPSRFSARSYPLQPRNVTSNYEVDYPVEDIFINGNIPPSMAIKINEAVEHDRFGNAYLTHHYAYQQPEQNLNFSHNQQFRHPSNDFSRLSGRRVIREINNNYDYPQTIHENPYQIYRHNNLPPVLLAPLPQVDYQIASPVYPLDDIPRPVNYFTAYALPNDPMRY